MPVHPEIRNPIAPHFDPRLANCRSRYNGVPGSGKRTLARESLKLGV